MIRVLNLLGFFFFLCVKNEVDKLRLFFFCVLKVLIIFFFKNCNYINILVFLIKILIFIRYILCKNDSEKFNVFIVCCGFKYLGYVGILFIE